MGNNILERITLTYKIWNWTGWKKGVFKKKWVEIWGMWNEMNGVLGYNSALRGYTGPGTTWANEMNFGYRPCPRCRINYWTCWSAVQHCATAALYQNNKYLLYCSIKSTKPDCMNCTNTACLLNDDVSQGQMFTQENFFSAIVHVDYDRCLWQPKHGNILFAYVCVCRVLFCTESE